MINFPKPLRPGDLIAVTAPSSGVEGAALGRLDLVIAHLRDRGYRVIEGQCLRSEYKSASAPSDARASEFMNFLCDPAVAAVFPPWGGELASELLESLDFESLREVQPKWLLGYSDVSTLHLPLTLISGWATAHGPNLMDLAPTQTDPLTTGTLDVLERGLDRPIEQKSSTAFQKQWTDFAVRVDAPLNLTERTLWQRLDGSNEPISFRGRLIGGCLDTIAWLAGTRFGDIPSFVRQHQDQGVILYLENVEMAPPGMVRALLALKRHGWFDDLAGLMIGRSTGPNQEAATSLSYVEALRSVLSELRCPALFDVDIGHQPPQFTLINGALATVHFKEGGGSVVQVKA
ncbi:muramoyltetrapeptide carboxypeptidase [Burkholderiales bacterium]|nr:muramoyltetrapeptide carboxypeptidase [Burkholderiales bacterium]